MNSPSRLESLSFCSRAVRCGFFQCEPVQDPEQPNSAKLFNQTQDLRAFKKPYRLPSQPQQGRIPPSQVLFESNTGAQEQVEEDDHLRVILG